MDTVMLDRLCDKYTDERGAIVELLQTIQTEEHYLPREALERVSANLDIPLSQLYGLATFYRAFSLKPVGKHQVTCCMGTACHVRGANELVAKVCTVLGIQPGETDPKQLFTLTTVHCMGCCALAPVMKIDDNYYSNPKTDDLKKIISAYEQQEQASWQN